jgi:hypothetical protein
MRPLSATVKNLLVAATLIAVGGCCTLIKSMCNVEFGKQYAAILPEAAVSESDCDALNQILKKRDKALYKIQTYQNGKLIKTRGALDERFIREGLVSEVATKAKTTGFTGCALQAGVVEEAVWKSSSTTKPPPQGFGRSSTTKKLVDAAEDLVKEVRPILEKYNRK